MPKHSRGHKFTRDDFVRVKKMQHSGWRKGTIMARTGWSERTVDRAMKSATWPVYRGRVAAIVRSMHRGRDFKPGGVYLHHGVGIGNLPGDRYPSPEDDDPESPEYPGPTVEQISKWLAWAMILAAITLFWYWATNRQ